MNTGIHIAMLVVLAWLAVFFFEDVENTYLGFAMITLWMVWFWFTVAAVMDDVHNWRQRE